MGKAAKRSEQAHEGGGQGRPAALFGGRGTGHRPLSMAVLSRLGGGAAAVTLGLFPVLAGLGLIETEGGIEPFARVLAVLSAGCS